jgi:drug/metabolite transporter (DMT)-like permease
MVLGVILVLASTLAHNGSAILFAAESRRHPPGPWLILSVGRGSRGALAVVLNFVGWGLEVAALTLISLTLTRVINVAGLALILLMSRWALGERVGRRGLLGTGVLALGILAATVTAPAPGGSSPSPTLWLLILAISLPVMALPHLLRAFNAPPWPLLAAVVAGLAYALSGVLNKGLADALPTAGWTFLVLGTLVVAGVGLWGFVIELDALQAGKAPVVVSVVLALHTVVPIAVAPLLFGEALPPGTFGRLVLGSGVLATLAGVLILAGSMVHNTDRRTDDGE